MLHDLRNNEPNKCACDALGFFVHESCVEVVECGWDKRVGKQAMCDARRIQMLDQGRGPRRSPLQNALFLGIILAQLLNNQQRLDPADRQS